MQFDGWCAECDLRSAVIDAEDATGTDSMGTAWATCTECGSGWIWRDELPESEPVSVRRHPVEQRTARAA
jgi:hypothetical protein